ncbi:hypothetical protein ACFX11_039264 [Malus domestica]
MILYCSRVGNPVCLEGIFVLFCPKVHVSPSEYFWLHNNQPSSQPPDLLTQLQAIKLVTEASKSTEFQSSAPNFYSHEGILSSPSSTSSSAAQEQATLQTFSWSDFLLEDAFMTIGDAQEHKNKGEYSSKNIAQVAVQQSQIDMDYAISSNEVEATSPACDSSFVEAMVSLENEMFLEFPELMEEPFYY